MYSVKILADSISDHNIRLTTLELTFPRIILAELNTHRMLSRNSASSRAIPVEKIIQRIRENPFIPEYWGKNQKGMQASEELSDDDKQSAIVLWKNACRFAIDYASDLASIGVHKQLINRLLEPFSWHTAIVSATDWANMLNLRDNKAAQPEFATIASMMRNTLEHSEPKYLKPGMWHLPLLPDKDELVTEGYSISNLIRISVGRCCRVSYLTHNGVRDPQQDIELANRLVKDGHMSPLEHVAFAMEKPAYMGNFNGWVQFRKIIPGESIYGL